MRTRKKSIMLLAIFTTLALLLPAVVKAGSLEPTAAPGATMHTLEDIYNKIDSIPTWNKALVEKTGQTTIIATGDDGDLKKGVAWPATRFTDNGNGTVTDNLTGLIWLKNANPCGKKTWTNALAYCNSLVSGMAGLTDCSVAGDWRLPNIIELQSLLDYGSFNPSLPSSHPFTGVQADLYWSSTSYASDTTNYAWYVQMKYGHVNNGYKPTASSYVWPVRSGQ